MLDGDEPGRKGRRRGLRLRWPRTDSFGVEGQHGEAVPLAASDRAPVAGDDGDRDGDGGGNRGSGRPRVRVSWTAGERGTGGGASEGAGGVEEGRWGSSLTTSGQQIERGQGGTVRGERVRQRRRERARQRLGRYRKEEGRLAKTPLATTSKIATRSSSNLSDLKEASGHLHKFQKNSYRLHLRF